MKKEFSDAISFKSTLTSKKQSLSSPLYQFRWLDNGQAGYDYTKPVPFFKGSNQFISILDTYTPPKNQFRSSWIATIYNLHFNKPSSQEQFQSLFLERVSTFKEWNMNALIFQIRPMSDAWYPSVHNPWSEFLSGRQGLSPNYDYDPLEWMIQETHKAGLEYHAWLNPYRVTSTKITSPIILGKTGLTKDEILNLTIVEKINVLYESGFLDIKNFAVQYPQTVLEFDERFFLNPGIPEVQEHVALTVLELINNYDLDAIHFDDYFYPYRTTVNGQTITFGDNNEDYETFKKYGQGYGDIEDWRRDNVTNLVKAVKSEIDTYNTDNSSSIQFGISPFGIWEHIEINPKGSHTPINSSKTYSETIFADTYKWVQEELIDYIVPQIYWSFDQTAAAYGELTRWWSNISEKSRTQLYIGHANYKHVSNSGREVAWLNPEEIPNQMRFNQSYYTNGSVFYSYNDLLPSDLEAAESNVLPGHDAKNQSIKMLKENYFNVPSLVPPKKWLSHSEINPPLPHRREGDNFLRWNDAPNNATRFFIIYTIDRNEKNIQAFSDNIVTRIWKDTNKSVFEFNVEEYDNSNRYFLSSVNQAGMESKLVEFD